MSALHRREHKVHCDSIVRNLRHLDRKREERPPAKRLQPHLLQTRSQRFSAMIAWAHPPSPPIIPTKPQGQQATGASQGWRVVWLGPINCASRPIGILLWKRSTTTSKREKVRWCALLGMDENPFIPNCHRFDPGQNDQSQLV